MWNSELNAKQLIEALNNFEPELKLLISIDNHRSYQEVTKPPEIVFMVGSMVFYTQEQIDDLQSKQNGLKRPVRRILYIS